MKENRKGKGNHYRNYGSQDKWMWIVLLVGVVDVNRMCGNLLVRFAAACAQGQLGLRQVFKPYFLYMRQVFIIYILYSWVFHIGVACTARVLGENLYCN